MFFISNAQAAYISQGQGRVSMQGAINDSACAISSGSRVQSISMDISALSDIARDGQGKVTPFNIVLVNCILARQSSYLPEWKQFQVTFDGDADGDLFGIHGEATGVALKISDVAGNIAIPGKPLPPAEITPGDQQLNYAMTLIANQQPLKVGNYFSSVRFKMDYY
ncbi:type 1 fimbrial protein [Serratia marcescens]